MSDYFGALMRSSGLAVGGAAPIVAPRVGGATPVEINVEHTTAPAATKSPAPTAAHDTNPVRMERARPVHDERSTAPLATADLADPARAGAPMEAAAITRSTIADDVPRAPVAADALVRAAMQWVAAGPQETREKPRAVVEPSNTPAHEEPASRGPHAIREQRLPAHDEFPGWHTGDEHQEAAPSLAQPARPLLAQPATLRAAPPAPASPRDDTVEVSIGAIHVRVDAPATQTVARTPPPPPAPRATSTPRTERSALSRRALRRI